MALARIHDYAFEPAGKAFCSFIGFGFPALFLLLFKRRAFGALAVHQLLVFEFKKCRPVRLASSVHVPGKARGRGL